MAEYSYEDVITPVDIISGKVKKEDIIGKEGWFTSNLSNLKNAIDNCDMDILFPGRLTMKKDSAMLYSDDDFLVWDYFISKKEATAADLGFKIGDRVRIVKEWIGWEPDDTACQTVGKIGVIKAIGDFSAKVEFYDGDAWWYNPNSLVLADEAIEKEKSYEECQAEWVKENNLMPGDKVRILKQFNIGERGVSFGFNDAMLSLIGEVCEVFEITDNRIRVYDKHRVTYWVWPYFCLEKVEEEPECDENTAYSLSELDIVELVEKEDRVPEELVGKRGYVRLAIPGECLVIKFDGYRGEQLVGYDKVKLIKKYEPEYEPFDLSKPEDRNFLRGKWIQDSRHGNEWMIVGFYLDETGGQGHKAKLSRKNAGFTGIELLERFTFLDGTPVGKLKEAGA